MTGTFRAVAALIRKEGLQIRRDPSALLIAFVLPVILLFLFAYAISLDIDDVRVGVVLESDGALARDLAAAYAGTPYIRPAFARDRREIEGQLVSGELRAMVVIPADFDRRLASGRIEGLLQIITDGSQPNTANFSGGYAQGVFDTWLANRVESRRRAQPLALEPRFWFNPELESRRVLLPGAIAIVMTMIGTLLTALVVAREWERGTMEALMSTPAGVAEILVGKLVPYFVLGLVTTMGCTAIAVLLFGLPLEGSLWLLLLLSAVFLIPALGQGLLISVLSRNQFIASQVALLTGFLPAFLLSGFLFEIDSMPSIIQWITRIVPARYYVEGLQTLFLAGDIWSQLLRNMLSLAVLGCVFLGITALRTRRTLD
jgi:ABC-2 type transport system permease protein